MYIFLYIKFLVQIYLLSSVLVSHHVGQMPITALNCSAEISGEFEIFQRLYFTFLPARAKFASALPKRNAHTFSGAALPKAFFQRTTARKICERRDSAALKSRASSAFPALKFSAETSKILLGFAIRVLRESNKIRAALKTQR